MQFERDGKRLRLVEKKVVFHPSEMGQTSPLSPVMMLMSVSGSGKLA